MSAGPLRSPPFVLLDDSRQPHKAGDSLLFTAPVRIIRADTPDEVEPALSALDEAVQDGFCVAGYVAYEAGLMLEKRLAGRAGRKAPEPLVWMLVCESPEILSPLETGRMIDEASGGNEKQAVLQGPDNFQPREAYDRAFSEIREYIESGDVYQVNYTGKADLTLQGDSLALYKRLRAVQPVPFGALMNTGDFDILSISPEQFLKCDGTTIQACPMKGTAARGRYLEEDEAIKSQLSICDKTRAENLMIVDLVRNDLSRVSEAGSVRVTSLFDIQTLPTVHQMTSTIDATVRKDTSPSEILRALFPCGSVTGAPKIRAMEIIDDLESDPRGVYCGAIGWFGPCGQLSLNVPIRTLVLDRSGAGRVHIGSGLVADSDAALEYEECRAKASFIHSLPDNRDLVETFRWSAAEGFRNLDLHLDRLERSARWLGWQPDRKGITRHLGELADTLDSASDWRIRLVAGEGLEPSITAARLPSVQLTETHTSCIADLTMNSSDPRLYNKFAVRERYDLALRESRARHPDIFDCILTNERGELTEGTFTNLFVRIGDELLTPPTHCGLLPGILRQQLLESGKARKAVLTPADLQQAHQVFLGNSLRGLVPVKVL